MKDAAPLLPDDVEWILTSGLNEKSVRRVPAIDSLKCVFFGDVYIMIQREIRIYTNKYTTDTAHMKPIYI